MSEQQSTDSPAPKPHQSPTRFRLTDRKIRALKSPATGRVRVYDEDHPGLCIELLPSSRRRPTGKKAWRYVFTVGGRTGTRGTLTLGDYPAVGLAAARSAYLEARAEVARGVNPAETKRRYRQAETVTSAFDRFVTSTAYTTLSDGYRYELARSFKKDILPAIGQSKVQDLVPLDVKRILDAAVDRGAAIQARHQKAYLSTFFSWCIREGLIQVNPCRQLKLDVKRPERDRVLTPDEIRRLWQGLEGGPVNLSVRVALRFQLATAQRIGEVLSARWQDMDLDTKVWTIPKTKNGKPHRVPLTPLALELLKQAPGLTGNEYVFPSPVKPGTAIQPKSLSKIMASIRRSLGLDRFTPHDLRRSAATLIASTGADREYVKRVLNHVPRDVTAVYDRYSYDDEKRRLLDTLARKIEAIVNGTAKVVDLHPGGRRHGQG